MDADDLTTEQAEQLRATVARHLRFFHRLCDRMNRLGFPPNDPLTSAAHEARNAVYALHVAAHYASCKHGVGRAPRPPGPNVQP